MTKELVITPYVSVGIFTAYMHIHSLYAYEFLWIVTLPINVCTSNIIFTSTYMSSVDCKLCI